MRALLPLLLFVAACNSLPQETKANEVYLPIAGFKSVASTSTHDGATPPMPTQQSNISVPILDKDGKQVFDADGNPVMMTVTGYAGDLFLFMGESRLDAHIETQVPGTNTVTRSDTATIEPKTDVTVPR